MSFQPNRIQAVLENIPSVKAADSIRSAFSLFGKDIGTSIFVLILLIIISAPIEFLDGYTGEYNILSSAYRLLISPILNAGWLFIAHRIYRQNKGNIADLFAGFKEKAGKIILVNLLTSLITLAAMAIPLGIVLSDFLAFYATNGFDSQSLMDYDYSTFGLSAALAILVAMILGFYFAASYFLSTAFVIFYNMGVWDAMEASRKVFNKNIGSFFVLGILLVLLNIGGALALLLGLLVTIPVSAYTTYTVFVQVADLPDNDEDSLLDELQAD